MLKYNKFAVVGGDKRQVMMSESIASDGHDVFAVGFDKADINPIVKKVDLTEALRQCKNVIFPLPVLKDTSMLNAPYSNEKILIDDTFARLFYEKNIFCGMSEKLKKTSKFWDDISIFDYSKREEFSIRNAVPTAEGAIKIAISEYDATINGSKCLVTGYGRIGKVLSKMLKSLGAFVTVSARKQEDLLWIDINGYNPILTKDIEKTSGYDIIFNTIPCIVFDPQTLDKCAKKAIIIDLASNPPGGIDFTATKRLGIKAIKALSLPGKTAPKTAGEIIKTTIYNIIKEEIK